MEIQAVINTKYGGFHFNQEMTNWLHTNRNWTLIKQKDYTYKEKEKLPLTTIIVGHDTDYNYTPTRNDSTEIRSHKDLVDCVRELQELHKNDSYQEKYYGYIHALKIVKIKYEVIVKIDDYHDGKERLHLDLQEEYDD